MKITKIETQIRRQGRYSVFIDGKFAFGLSELGLIDSGLRLGQELGEAEVHKLKNQAEIDKAYNLALGMLARRPRSKWEMREYLRRKGYDQPIIEEILNKLSVKGFIDDEDFARRWVESRRMLKPISKRKLHMELRQKRLSDEVINKTLANDEADEAEVLRSEITRKRRQSRYRDDQKLIAYLARQGYRYSDIKEALQKEDETVG